MNPITTSALSLRRRGVWEAIDSGILLWRNSFAYFIPFFAIPFWIIACGLRLLPGIGSPGINVFISYLILWWLKPLFDRLVLHVVSLRFFGDPAPYRLKELSRGLWGTISRGLLGDLLWRRFSPGRAACTPVRVLEHLEKKQFRLRKNTLAAGGLDFSPLVSVLSFALELMLLAGEILFFILIIQMFFPTAIHHITANLELMEVFIFAAFCFNYIIVQSLYVCLGFGLYINSRVTLEGWDLQLLFKKFADRGSKVILFVCFFLTLLFAPKAQTAFAAQYFPDNFPVVSEKSLEYLQDILASPDFGSERDGWGIRFKRSFEPREMPDFGLSPRMERLRQAFGHILRILVIVVLAGFLGFVLYWLLKNNPNLFGLNFFSFFRRNRQSRNRLKGYTNPFISAESPESLFKKSQDFYARGFQREAWAACLAGCLGAYSRYRRLSFPVDATEYGCLDLVRKTLPGEAESFGELVQYWILFAYGGRSPGERAYEQALAYGHSIAHGAKSDEPQ